MKLLVLFAVLGVALCEAELAESEEERPDWANETLFGKHQDSWASLQRDVNSTYYLMKSTYNNDSVWGSGFTCVSVTATNATESNKSVTAEIKYKKENQTNLQTSSEIVQAVKMYNYSKENAIKYTVLKAGGENITIEDALVFTNKMCDIYYTKKGDYELWVHQNKTKEPPACCDFMFRYLALNKTIYPIYNINCTSENDV
uniref:Lipocalin n=1 Tax=Rhipicephalus zambeziensis TaxID=60191 RepID=A0A224YMP2_9ACAR